MQVGLPHGNMYSARTTLWFVGQKLNSTVSPGSAAVLLGRNERPPYPTTTVWVGVEPVSVSVSGTRAHFSVGGTARPAPSSGHGQEEGSELGELRAER